VSEENFFNDLVPADTPAADAGFFSDLVPESKSVRVMAYGPVVGEHHHSAMFGPEGNALQPYDVAASPNLGLQLGEWINVNGKDRRVADWSYLKPGVPTKDTIEIRDDKDQGHGTFKRVNLTPDEIRNRISEFPQVAGEATKQAVGEASKAQGDAGMFADLIPSATPTATPSPSQTNNDAGIFSDLVPQQATQIQEPPPADIPEPTDEEPSPTPTPTPVAAPKARQQIAPPPPSPEAQVAWPPLGFYKGAYGADKLDQPSALAKLQGIPQDQVLDHPLVPAEYMPPFLIAKGAEAVLPQNPVTQVYEGEMKGVADILSGFTSPANVAMLATGGLMGKLATRLVGTAFSAQAAARMPDAWKRFNETDNPQEKTRIAIGVIAGIGLPLLAWADRSPKIQKQIQSEIAKTTSELPPAPAALVAQQELPQQPAPRPAPQIPEPASFSVDMPTDTFGSEFTPVAAEIIGNGGLMSKSTAQRYGVYDPALWEDASRMSHPTHNKIYASTVTRVKGANAKLPRELSGAKPRYGYGSKLFQLKFLSDVDKAAYITAQAKRSKADAAYLKFAMDATGMSEAQVREHGKTVRDSIKEQAKFADDGGVLTVLDHGTTSGKATVRSQFARGVRPDIAAQALYDSGLISDPSVQAMWDALDKESKAARSTLKAQRSEAQGAASSLKEQAGQRQAFIKAEKQEWQGGAPAVPVKDLQVGDTVTVRGEKLKVTDIDPDTYDVTLEDGRQFGVQTVSDNTVLYGEHESSYAKGSEAKSTPEFSETKWEAPPVEPPTPPTEPPIGAAPPSGEMPETTLEEATNPVPGSGKFKRSYRIDKELGDRMEGIGAARESGALRAELHARNMLGELSPLQEKNLGQYLVSDRLKSVNPLHPQILSDKIMRAIESDPAIQKALDYYKSEIKPDIEGWRKRAGLSEKAAAGKSEQFISLLPKTDQLLPEKFGGVQSARRLPRTTVHAKAAKGQAQEYDTDLRNILRESYGEAIRKALVREFYAAAKAKNVASTSRVFTPDGWKNVVQFEDLPPELAHDLSAATQAEPNRMAMPANPNPGWTARAGDIGRKIGKTYQSTVTGFALTANPAELMNHMRRQLNLVASKSPVGMGVMARLEALVPYFGPKIGVFKRAVMENMNTPENQAILTDIFDAGGGSTRSFGERYGSKIPGIRQLKNVTNNLLFGIPKGQGLYGWDLRMRVQLEKIRRAAEGNRDPQRIREFANQIGQYGSHPNWFIGALRKINPYAATTVPMRITELKTAVGISGFKNQGFAKGTIRNVETFLRGTGGTILAMATANYLLSGKWPWENDAGHEFDLNMGVKNKDGKTVYVKLRAIAPELARPVSTVSLPDLSRETTAKHPQYLSAGLTGPANQLLSLVSGPGQNLAATALTGKVPYFLKRPGEGPELMDVATLRKGEQQKSRGLRQLREAAKGLNPFGDIFGSQFEVSVPDGLGYLEEPVKGIRPFGKIFSTSYERRGGSSVVPPPPAVPPPPPPP
jgi:hypothetical protein